MKNLDLIRILKCFLGISHTSKICCIQKRILLLISKGLSLYILDKNILSLACLNNQKLANFVFALCGYKRKYHVDSIKLKVA